MVDKNQIPYCIDIENLVFIHTDNVRNYENQVPYCPVTKAWVNELVTKYGIVGEIRFDIYRIPGTPDILIRPVIPDLKKIK
ncbi:MAG: hypothetical protein CO103_03840 [Chloroflexi bacterium CG_4_9_14_3_um_filter_45_9]|nr:MAG: hypothetical protein CO103_03840 [Chloroflexi bacterium CG_4_9_14_3_um_filter_45_9]